MPRDSITPPEIYAQQLEYLGKGTALFYPGPYDGVDNVTTNIELADVGYLERGRFYKLFNAADPPKELKDKGHLPYIREFVDDYNKTWLNDDKFVSRTVSIRRFEASAGGGIPKAADASLSFSIECHEDSGAALLLPSTTHKGLIHHRLNYRGGVDGYAEYFYNHCNDWLEYADRGARELELKDLLFVTDVHRASKWLLYCFTRKASAHFGGAESQALNGSLQIGISGSRLLQTDHGVHCNEAKDRSDAESAYDQSVFVGSFKMHKRRNPWVSWAIAKLFARSLSNGGKSGGNHDGSARGRAGNSRGGLSSLGLGGSRSIGGSAGNGSCTSDSERASSSRPPGPQAGHHPSAMSRNAFHLSLPDLRELDVEAVSDNATRDSSDSEYESNLLDEELLDPHSALLEYILEACPDAQYSCASIDDLKQFKEYLSDWAAFPGVLRQIKPEIMLEANGLASLVGRDDSHGVAITDSLHVIGPNISQSDLEDASDPALPLSPAEAPFRSSSETNFSNAPCNDGVDGSIVGSGNETYQLQTATSSGMGERSSASGPANLQRGGASGQLSRALGGEHATGLSRLATWDDAEVTSNSNNRTTLAVAAKEGHEAVLTLLLAHDDVDVNWKDVYSSRTALSFAAENGHDAIVMLLLARDDVDVNSKDTSMGRTALSFAAENGHEGVVRALLARDDVDVNSKDTIMGRTALSFAAEKGHEGVVRALLARDDVEVNSKSPDGQTPLLLAAKVGHERVVELLLTRKDVDVDSKDTVGSTRPDTLMSLGNVASTYQIQGLFKNAEELQVQVMEVQKRVLVADHPDTLTSMANLASTYQNQGRFKEAEELQVQVMEMQKKVLGAEHPSTLTSMVNLASTFQHQGRLKEAEELQVQVMEMQKKVLGAEHPYTLTSMGELALTYCREERWQEAEKLQAQVVEMRRTILGEDHPYTLTSMGDLASTYRKQGRLAEAEELQVQVMKMRKTILGADHPSTLTSMANLASTYQNQERFKEAEELQGQVVEMRKRVLGLDHPDTLQSMRNFETLKVPVTDIRKRVYG